MFKVEVPKYSKITVLETITMHFGQTQRAMKKLTKGKTWHRY
jgi:hypothetical protein